MSVLESIKEKVLESTSIVILTHEHPDGDAIGSSLALLHGLRKLGKEADVFILGAPKCFGILPSFNEIKEYVPEDSSYDLCIALDSSDLERLGSYKDVFLKAKNTIVIDHHITNQNFGDVNYVNAVASSTCQNLLVILAYLDVAISKEIAACAYAGILTDTGGFRYNVQTETFELAGMLLETGIDVSKIYRNLFDISSEPKTKLLGRALERLEVLSSGRIAFTYVLKADEEEFKTQEGDHENIVNYGRNIEGVEVSILVHERDDKFKISLRSNEYLDVSLIATKYGGGGHMKAAGMSTDMSLDLIKQTIVSEVEKQLK